MQRGFAAKIAATSKQFFSAPAGSPQELGRRDKAGYREIGCFAQPPEMQSRKISRGTGKFM
jgi:hypothetical protein